MHEGIGNNSINLESLEYDDNFLDYIRKEILKKTFPDYQDQSDIDDVGPMYGEPYEGPLPPTDYQELKVKLLLRKSLTQLRPYFKHYKTEVLLITGDDLLRLLEEKFSTDSELGPTNNTPPNKMN